MQPKAYYEKNISGLTGTIARLKKARDRVSVWRMLCAGLVISIIYFLFKESHPLLWGGLVLTIYVFLLLVKKSNKLKEALRYNNELLKINENEIKALDGDISSFDPGLEFINPGHPYSYDLDLFGHASVFQLLNRTCTLHGKELLAHQLTNPGTDKSTIGQKQQAAIELRDKADWRQQFQATGQLSPESHDDKKQIEDWLQAAPKYYKNKVYAFLRTALPAITLLSLGLYFVEVTPLKLTTLLFTLQLIITGRTVKYVNRRQTQISKHAGALNKYHRLMEVIEKEDFTSDHLMTAKAQTFQESQKPSESFRLLIKFLNALDNRLNIIVGIVLNGFLLWDINQMYRIEKWADEFNTVFPKWLEAIAHFDATCSLANFMYNHPDYIIPRISDSNDFRLQIKGGGHPLIREDELVTNDVEQHGPPHLFLITGANMAGKSTFLRMIGVNLVLAMAGTAVCAKDFEFTPVKLYTSMRTNDSVQQHTSFFFAELKRLKFIVDRLRSGEKSYILLDEILKGTNSHDQHTGSRRLIENIINLNGVGMIATHDVELTGLASEHPGHIQNIAFEIRTENGRMIFDYTYKEGVCQNMNATMLMEQMNIFRAADEKV
ncbi:MAG: hypothetical protein KDD36_13145 [Flavobacteriales bacterium]|nr:hypothetical protein [Flavobacteriales bacterium]